MVVLLPCVDGFSTFNKFKMSRSISGQKSLPWSWDCAQKANPAALCEAQKLFPTFCCEIANALLHETIICHILHPFLNTALQKQHEFKGQDFIKFTTVTATFSTSCNLGSILFDARDWQ
ncbi:hypothetical protein KIL84_014634 [Mauremys mutica]|uniref:Uncharacterized protein n=1 Tax=Mauremys mutica TaxID=74926 RepID=A0A9D4B7D3_9SAUR|nr:hypothetical protein KIL84_014634 [Mauremys mutica]